MQLMGKGDSVLNKHLLTVLPNEMQNIPCSKTIQNEAAHIYACKIRKRLTRSLREGKLLFIVIADETTDNYAKREILSVCLRFVDLSSP